MNNEVLILLWIKANSATTSKRQCIKKFTFSHKIKAMIFPVVLYRCESWTMKKAEHWKTDAFILWCWRRCLRVPWTARRSNQSILKERNSEYLLEGLILRLKFQNFGYWCEGPTYWKRLMLGNIESRRRRGQQRMSSLDCLTNSVDVNLSKLKEIQDKKAWHSSWGHKESDTT